MRNKKTGRHLLRQRELLAYFRDDFFPRISYINGDGILRFFEVGELAGQEFFRGVVSLARMHALAKKIVITFQIDQLHAGIDLQPFALALFERGACQNDVPLLVAPLFHCFANRIQPRDAVAVVEGHAARHFLYVRR